MFNLTAALVPLAKKTLVQKLLPGVDAEGLKICLVMTSIFNLALLPLGLFWELSPNPLLLARIPFNLMIQVTLGFSSVCLGSGLRYSIYWIWCHVGYKGECGSGACGDCRLKKNQNEQDKTKNTKERNEECLRINIEKSNGLS